MGHLMVCDVLLNTWRVYYAIKFVRHEFSHIKVLGQGHVYKATFGQFGIFVDFPLTFAEPKIYLYLTDSKIFGCFEKL